MEENKKSLAALVIGIIGISVIGISVILGIIGSLIYMFSDDYDYESTKLASGLINLARSFFWGGAGLNLFALILSYRNAKSNLNRGYKGYPKHGSFR